jgi:hypothetical protein
MEEVQATTRKDNSALRQVGGGPLDVFVHVPKTAGTSLRAVLAQLYGDRYAHLPGGIHDLVAIDRFCGEAAVHDRIRAVIGHIPYGVMEAMGRPCRYFTILRDPVDRAVSAYFYARERVDNYSHEDAMKNSFEAFVSLRRDRLQAESHIRYVVGIRQRRAVTRQDLEEAKRLLSDVYVVVGLFERLNEFVAMCAATYGWPDPTQIRIAKEKTTRTRPTIADVPTAWRRSVMDATPLDVELVNWVRESGLAA